MRPNELPFVVLRSRLISKKGLSGLSLRVGYIRLVSLNVAVFFIGNLPY